MVTKGGSAITGKRKKTDDMPDSPPKRVTRARAKATDDVETKSKPDKAATASSKAAVDKKKASVPTKASKRKTRADDEDEAPKQQLKSETEVVDKSKAPPAKHREKQKQTSKLDEAEIEKTEAPRIKGRQPRGVTQEKPVQDAPKTRGRPKKAADEIPAVVVKPLEPDNTVEPARKVTRGRSTTKSSKPPATNTTSKAATTKKKVKFQEEPDKENIPMESEVPKKSAMKPTGLKAKPVRKPATTGTTSRGRMATRHTAQITESLPLSPKKVNQVTKTGSTSSEDELSGEKTPIRALSRSPSKPLGSPVRSFGSVSKLNLTQPGAPTSPSKTITSAILASPARRPPGSPFKDALKTSPKKFNLGNGVVQPVLLSSQTPVPQKTSLLQESPRKGNIGDRKVSTILPPSQTPLKASLLQSPARRPMGSPFKVSSMKSPGKPSTQRDVEQGWPLAAPTLSPPQAASSPFRAARSPEPVLRVHKITDEERKAEEIALERPAHQNETFATGTADSKPAKSPERPGSSEIPVESARSALTSSMFVAPAFSTQSAALRRISIESGSEDELASPEKIYAPTPLKRYEMFVNDNRTPAITAMGEPKHIANEAVPMTPLANQLSSWLASTPSQQIARNGSRQARGVFSLGGATTLAIPEQDDLNYVEQPYAKSSFFEDEMAVFDGQEDKSIVDFEAVTAQNLTAMQTSHESQASEEYGDENAAPIDAEVLREEQNFQDHTLTCTPAKVFTSAKQASQQPREIYTVSKVPLRPSAEYSPPHVQRQRSRSFGDLLSSMHEAQELKASNLDDNESDIPSQPSTPLLTATLAPKTPSSGMKLEAETPGRTIRKGVVPDVLKGAVVYVDVHTTEGADASGIFVDLLTQMGARCVKQWNWNPRASFGRSYDSNDATNGDSPASSPSASKVGITHVVYKDGGKRTLEKVRSSNGAVLCVGVGWVLDCEREDKWLDEADYAIDTSMIPRGGHRRRKSMEPRALANLGGNLVSAANETPAKSNISPTKEFLTFDTPASRRDTFVIDPQHTQIATEDPASEMPDAPSTPTVTFVALDDNMPENGQAWGSPTTPYYLSKGAELVQRTCPPKHDARGLFPVSGNVEDQPDECVRQRLIAARRKSLQWVSKTRSPLGRTVSYGK